MDLSSFPVRVPVPVPTPERRWLPGRRPLALVVVLAVWTAHALGPFTRNPFLELLGETLFVGLMLLFAFTLAGAWRQTWMPRWVVQVLAVAVAAVVSPLVVQMVTVGGDFSMFIRSRPLVGGYAMVTFSAFITGVVLALGALYRERDAQARADALQFALERETLECQAAEDRLHLLTARIEPHFLLNTLANVQALVETGSPQAVPVFRSLIAYLRAAMQQLQDDAATLGDEEQLVRSYLELMHMRMPDRLKFSIEFEDAVRDLVFPPMALLTLVENAIRHGIDPACDGGSVDIGARRLADQSVQVWVVDSGVGMPGSAAPGIGLGNLQKRLKASFGEAARLVLSPQIPQGVRADIYFVPVKRHV